MKNINPGFGIGFRPAYFNDVVMKKYAIDWFEIISEDYMIAGGLPLKQVSRIREDYPLAMHGVSLSIGGTDAIDKNYLNQLKLLADRIDPLWISDHVCWTGIQDVNLHDLLPLPYNQEVLQHLISRIQYVQDYLQQPLVLENISTYINFKQSDMSEWEFLNELVKHAGCRLLLDINNIYVNAFNHGFSAEKFIDEINHEAVIQYHLAGHKKCYRHIVDTHDRNISEEVWRLYAYAAEKIGERAMIIERDDALPPLQEIVQELEYAKELSYVAA